MKRNIEKLDSLKKDLSELQRMSDENMNKIDSIILKFEEIVRNMKGVTMEQDIEILEELLNAKITFTISPTDYGWKALEHLIKAYKELEELNIEINEKDINEAINKAREQRNKEIKSIKEK